MNQDPADHETKRNYQAAPLETKDLLLTIPLLATSLALSWEVGRFVPVGGFEFFSITEHLTAAARALPIALLGSISIVFGHVLSQLLSLSRWPSANSPTLRSFTLLIGIGASFGLAWYFQTYLAVALAAAAFPAAALIAYGTFLQKPLRLALAWVLVLLLAVAFGTYQTETRSRDLARRSMIKLSSGDISGFMVMTGERGTLFEVPDVKGGSRIVFIPANLIQQIETPKPAGPTFARTTNVADDDRKSLDVSRARKDSNPQPPE